MRPYTVQDSIYVGTRDRVLKIPAQHCGRHRSKEACMNSMDPYCGWNEHVDRCQPPTNGNILEHNWRQDVTKCPDRSRPIDGDWSSWSAWAPCMQNVNSKESVDQCLCSSRTCTNPEPKYGGADCQGPTIQVIAGGHTVPSVRFAEQTACLLFNFLSCTSSIPNR